jgi:MerR family redox-sensitive transcriptional activator SoxR
VADHLTIGEFSRRSGVSQSALRFYERLGLIRSTRTGGNQRRYQRTELRRVAFIRVSSQVGIPLEEIKAALAALPAERTPTKADWERLSRAWQRRLDEQIALLQRLRDTLTGCIGCGCLSLRSCGLANWGDRLAAEGSGPVRLLKGS